jgi:hypothetical protein
MERDTSRIIGEADFQLYEAMQECHNRIGDMLAYVSERSNSVWVRRYCERRFRGLAPDATAQRLDDSV